METNHNDGSSEHFTCPVDVGEIMLSCVSRRQIHRRRTLPDAPVHHTALIKVEM